MLRVLCLFVLEGKNQEVSMMRWTWIFFGSGYVKNRPPTISDPFFEKAKVLDTKLIKSSSQSKTNGCICNIKVIISLFFDDTTFRVYAHYEFQCLSFFMRCSSSSYSNLCVGFHVNLFNVCEKIVRPHTRTRCGTLTLLHVVLNARSHAHIFFSVCCYEQSGFYIILCTPFYWAIIFFLYFFLTNVENGREKLGKKSTSLFANFLFRVCHKIEKLLVEIIFKVAKLLLRNTILLILCFLNILWKMMVYKNSPTER